MNKFLITCLILTVSSLASASDKIERLRNQIISDSKTMGLKKALRSKTNHHNLAKFRLYQLSSCEQFTKFEASPAGVEFLGKFLENYEWLEKTLCQGAPIVRGRRNRNKTRNERYSEAIIRLAIICRKYPIVWRNKKLQKIASAVAFSAPFNTEDRTASVRSFGYFYDSIKRKQLIPEFFQYEPWMMRSVVWYGDTSSWLQKKYSVPPQALHNMAWNVSYRLWNIFDDSIHRSSYHEPWGELFGSFQVSTDIGGVCGAISKVGTLTANSHGAPCITMGQPGHCAYAYYNFENKTWYRGNDVSRPSTPHHSILDHSFHGFSVLQMTMDTFSPYKDYVKAAHANWLAHAFSTSSSSTAEKLFALSCKFKAHAYDFRHDYLQFLVKKEEIKNSQIFEEFKKTITDFIAYPDQAWQLVMNAQPLIDKLPPKAKEKIVGFFHENAGKQKFDQHVMYTNLLKHQIKLLEDGRYKIKNFVSTHYPSGKTPANWDLEEILNPKEKK